MQDLRYVTKKGVSSYCLHNWLENASIIYSRYLYPAGIRKIITSVLNTILALSLKFSFCHGDLHVGNIYIHSSLDEIKNVYLLDFGYSMIKHTGEHSSSPYWLEYKDGVDSAILLWSLHKIPEFKDSVSWELLNWISRKLILADGFDLSKLKTSADLYKKIDSLSLEELAPLRTETISREFFLL
jgi:hypothetical protein